MSDFLFSRALSRAGELAAALARHPGLPGAERREVHGAWGSLAVALPAFERLAVCEGPDHVSVVVGGPIVRLPGSAPGRLEHGERRRLLHEALAEPRPELGEWLDGHFAVLVLAAGTAWVFTDRFGFAPVFASGTGEDRLLGTHADALALAAGRHRDIDLVSAADQVANLTCTFPYTLYEGVRQLRPGTLHAFSALGESEARYWQPAETARFRTPGEAAEALRAAVVEGVSAAVAEAERAALLLSGGEDSRTVLAAVPAGVDLRAVIYAEWETREVRIARRVASAHGARLDVGRRSADHYEAGFPIVTALLGSQHSFIDFHGHELATALRLHEEPVVLGGLSADSLLKALYAPEERQPFRSARPPQLRVDLLEEADARRNRFLAELRQLRPRSADEWLQLWPFSMRKHGGNVDGNRRVFRSWEAFHATAALEVAAAAPREWKKHRALFLRALRPLLRRTRFVPHAEYRFPYYGPLGNALLLPPLALARGVGALVRGEVRARHRPWPKWGRVADSALMRAREEALLHSGSPLAALFDTAPERALPAVRAWYSLRRLMLVQLAHLARD